MHAKTGEGYKLRSRFQLLIGMCANRGTNMNKFTDKIIMAAFVLAFLLPIQVFAQSSDSFQVDPQGNVTLTSSHAAREGISSLQFSLRIESSSADSVEFQFSPNLAKVSETRYHEDTGILNVYIAGTEALFPENAESLTIGRVVVLDSGKNGTPATVSVVADSLKYVYGTELGQAEELQVPEAVTINVASSDSGGSSSGSQGSDSSNNTQSQGNDNLSGNTTSNFQDTAPSSQNNTSDAQSSGSDTSGRQPQSSASNGPDSTPWAENYTSLSQTLENARGFKEGDYTSESYEALRAAMLKAEEVLEDPNATSKEIDEALTELENAIGALVTKEETADDFQQSGEQETGEISWQKADASLGTKEEAATDDSRLPMFLLIAGIVVLVGCAAAVVVIKIRTTD